MRVDPGFTLVEILVALVAGALVLAGLSATLITLQRQYARMDETSSALTAVTALEPMLRRLVEQAAPVAVDSISFAANDRALRLVVPAPQALEAPGLVQLDLVALRQAKGETLVAQLSALPSGPTLPASATRPVVLAEGLASIRFATAFAPADPSMPDARRPRLISLHFEDKGASRRIDIVPKLTGDGRCRFDPISLACRG